MKKNKSFRNPLKWIKRKLCLVPANNIIEDTKAEPTVAVVASSVLSPPSDGHDGEKKHGVDNVKRSRSEAEWKLWYYDKILDEMYSSKKFILEEESNNHEGRYDSVIGRT
ncbi:hypothetical protein Syun_021485 [Stephania yunnanensis]|uniref:Uncharacterized protein n=1 Tax=Stephania yunnanensis TaxID=152371 RepID=A0AAP0IFU7_9MAGN